jgi:hypothetical protein
VTLTPCAFMSFAAWSTPFLKTDQNDPVSPCVTTATLMPDTALARTERPRAKALAGEPSSVAPAVRRPPPIRTSRRLRRPVSSIS